MERWVWIVLIGGIVLAGGIGFALWDGSQTPPALTDADDDTTVVTPPKVRLFDNVTLGNVDPKSGTWQTRLLTSPAAVECVWNLSDARERRAHMVTAEVSLAYSPEHPWTVDASLAKGAGSDREEVGYNASEGPVIRVIEKAPENGSLPYGQWSLRLTPHPPNRLFESCSWTVSVVVTFYSDEVV